MKAKQSHAAALFAAPLSKTARTLAALQAKLESEPGAVAPVAAAVVEEDAAPVEEVIASEEVIVSEEETTEG
jgi:large subunit ribosomal protein L10